MTGNDIATEVGSPAVLQCNVVNSPNGTIVDYQWRRANMSPLSGIISQENPLYLPYVGVSDAGVYICEVNINDSTNNPNVISQSGSVNIILTVTSK